MKWRNQVFAHNNCVCLCVWGGGGVEVNDWGGGE